MPAAAFDAVVLPLTPVTDVVTSFLLVDETVFTKVSLEGEAYPVTTVFESFEFQLAAAPDAVAPSFVVVAVP